MGELLSEVAGRHFGTAPNFRKCGKRKILVESHVINLAFEWSYNTCLWLISNILGKRERLSCDESTKS